jgi:uncharacterized phiE125 gp8 family phage protein
MYAKPYVWEVSAIPGVEPVSLEEAKTHLRIPSGCDSDNDYILALIKAARIWAEKYQRRAYITQTQVYYLDCFPSRDIDIDIPNPPLIGVTSIQYVDTGGDTQTLSTDIYDVDTVKQPGRVYLKHNQSYPATRDQRKAVTITYTCGYGTAGEDVPDEIRQAILIVIQHLYDTRQMIVAGMTVNEVPFSAHWLLDLERMDIL